MRAARTTGRGALSLLEITVEVVFLFLFFGLLLFSTGACVGCSVSTPVVSSIIRALVYLFSIFWLKKKPLA
jgi:hypothetical protein